MKTKILFLVILVTLLCPGLVHACLDEETTIVDGVELQTIFNVAFEESLIQDVYGQINYGKYEPNQIVCRATYIYEEDKQVFKLIPLVMWSVWYRPGLQVSMDTECQDTRKKPWITSDWYNSGYRWLGSGVEPHPELIWLWQYRETKTLPEASFTWCKAKKMAFVNYDQGEANWSDVFKNAIFEYTAADDNSALVSRDVSCTSDQSLFSKWMGRSEWSFVDIGE